MISLPAKPITYLKAISFAVALLGGGIFWIASDDSEILIESRESKTIDGNPIFNKIKRFATSQGQIWMMNQSHYGLNAPEDVWERLVLKIYKDKDETKAQFSQLSAGPLELSSPSKNENLRVACFMCHTNGPRAIRPNYNSALAPISFKNRMRIAWWNLQIASSGRIVLDEKTDLLTPSPVPVRFPGRAANVKLDIKTCNHCHKETGSVARGPLFKQNFMAIRFMVETGVMPPPGYSLSPQELKDIKQFAQF